MSWADNQIRGLNRSVSNLDARLTKAEAVIAALSQFVDSLVAEPTLQDTLVTHLQTLKETMAVIED